MNDFENLKLTKSTQPLTPKKVTNERTDLVTTSPTCKEESKTSTSSHSSSTKNIKNFDSESTSETLLQLETLNMIAFSLLES